MNEDIIRQVDAKFYEKHEPELGDTYTEFMEEWNTMEMWEKEKCEFLDKLYGNMEDKGTDECLGTDGIKDRKTDVPENN